MQGKSKRKTEYRPVKRLRIVFLGVSFCLLLAALSIRIGYIKYTYGASWEKKAITLQITGKNNVESVINPNRGSILDRNRQSLAVSSTVYNVVIDVRLLVNRSAEAQERTLTTLSNVLSLPLAELQHAVSINPETGKPVKDTNYYIIARQVMPKTVDEIKAGNVVDVIFVDDTKRNYIHGSMAAQVLGFVRGNSPWGLEATYNKDMTGEPGRLFRMYDNDNNVVTEQIPPKQGYSVVTNIDLSIQQIAETAVKKAGDEYETINTAVLVMNPMTGEVLAMAQYPDFDLNDPMNPELITNARFRSELDALPKEKQPDKFYSVWKNFNIASTFEPGSIFKPIVVAAALEENKISLSSKFFCGAKINVNGTDIPCWNANGHGSQTLTEAMANSCNVALIQIVQMLGRDLFFKYRNDFGYGEKTGIDLPGEEEVSSPSVMYTLNALRPVELATSSMGQGFNNTPIQAINSFATVINGGNLMKPYVVSQVIDTSGNVVRQNSPQVQRKVISKETSDIMRSMLQQVVTPTGTGRRAVIQGYNIGGKTGTGQQGIRSENRYTLSFVAYLPTENPEIIALAIINEPKTYMEGSTSAAPMLRQVLLDIIKYKNIKPSGEVSPKDDLTIGETYVALENYAGKNVADATKSLNKYEFDYEMVGSGEIVKSQIPAAGAMVSASSRVYLYLAEENSGTLAIVPNTAGLTVESAVEAIEKVGFKPKVYVEPPKATPKPKAAPQGEPVTWNVAAQVSGGAQNGGSQSGGSATASGNAATGSSTAGSAEPQNGAGAAKPIQTPIPPQINVPYVKVTGQMPPPDIKIPKGSEIKIKISSPQ